MTATPAVLFCWTGTGASIAANKVGGRPGGAVHRRSDCSGRASWNDANVLVMGLRLTSAELAHEMLDAWFTTDADPAEASAIASLEQSR